jgi:hypothetical protein
MMINSTRLFGTAALVVLLATLFPSIALAHERRTVGHYTFVVGWLNEPSYQGQQNGLDLTITDANGTPVEGAEKTLKLGIAFGGSTAKDLPLRARFGLKGKYTTDVIPSKAGSYSFVFSGTVNGDAVSETFESGPGRFDDVVSPSSIEFPAATDAASQSAASSNGDPAVQRATIVGGAGVAVGLIGIILGAVAIAMRGRSAESPADETVHTSASV